ncbi:MAG: 2-amino-4-hydroxy-6-hydroxymethyldihydropteridine diphosphokinase [Alphaproteobacteria bacterium]|nr:2-amino-4-hydroxy-6-hydroxymethyldihydropteridine diphosphokinase [Alphaproteobacteria bacterium]
MVVGLGSSLGDRRRALALAVAALHAQPEAEVLRVSRVYLSPPAGGIARGSFLNAALRLRWAGALPELLARCQSLERRLGRRPAPRWADRALDLDLLWSPGRVVDAPGLRLPHPALAARPFAWAPLLDVWPGARDPRTGQAYGGGLAPAVVGVLQRPD